MKWDNPWADTEGFIDLGIHTVLEYNATRCTVYELYALVNKNTIDFGARYGNEGNEYISGAAYRHGNEWEVSMGGIVALAAARYFANHHKKGE